jgi:UPF0755 protein
MIENDSQDIGSNKLGITLNNSLFKRIIFSLVVLLATALVFLLIVDYLNRPPVDFPVGQTFTIEEGMNVKEIAEYLKSEGLVKSASVLYFNIVFLHDATKIKASTYFFDEPLTSREVANRLTEGDFGRDLIRFTHIEGERATSIAKRASEVLVDFDAETFVLLAEPYEGRLYPETYFIPKAYSEQELLTLLLDNFAEAVVEFEGAIANHSLSLDQIIILASIIEREANSPTSMRMVSGILQNRLTIGMPLQADASIEYVLDKPLAELTPEDLEIDTPYNTYLNKGLPPTPIGNPGKLAIQAVLEPMESEYYYYLTDDNGEFHYAQTYAEHLRNIERYLR